MGNSKRTSEQQKEESMKRITTKEAARMLGVGEQACRMMIQLEKIPGAFCYGKLPRRTYFITDEQVRNLMKGETDERR